MYKNNLQESEVIRNLDSIIKRYDIINYLIEKYFNLLNIVKNLTIYDSSHKNIMIEGVCYFHNSDKQIIKI